MILKIPLEITRAKNVVTGEIQSELEVFMKSYTLLSADDTIIMAESPTELQDALNSLHEYCQLWSLTVNITKSKIAIFSKGKVRKHAKFYLNQNESYWYINQARKPMFVVLERSRILKLPFDIVCELYEKCVVHVSLYDWIGFV